MEVSHQDLVLFTISCLAVAVAVAANVQPPNIVIILADDLGWNDVSFHGSNQFLTPNIDALAYSGVILHDYYSQPICTPARAALLTGRHPVHNGMQHDVIYAPQPWGLPLQERLLSQELQDRGYVTRAVGKWHLGFFKGVYTPVHRGFHSHFGTWLGHQNHYTRIVYGGLHTMPAKFVEMAAASRHQYIMVIAVLTSDQPHPGYDLHRGLNISWEGKDKYSSDLFTEEAESLIQQHNVAKPLFLYLSHTVPHSPVQAPQKDVNRLKYIPWKKRRTYAAMVTKLDESVGRVMQSLKDKNMLNNTIILFLSDNGGATNGYNGNVASNWPLRGGKDTLWEGGVRTVGVVWSPLLKDAPRVHRGLVNVQDWFTTLLEASGKKLASVEGSSVLVGTSQWQALNNKTASRPYTTMLHNIDPIRRIAAIRYGRWKLVVGRTHMGAYDGWYGETEGSTTYDITAIRNSPAGRAVQTTSKPLPPDWTMKYLRKQATVSCNSAEHKQKKGAECKPQRKPCLFDVESDPCEQNNLAARYRKVVGYLMNLLNDYPEVRPRNKHSDPRSFPQHWNNTWTHWADFVPHFHTRSS